MAILCVEKSPDLMDKYALEKVGKGDLAQQFRKSLDVAHTQAAMVQTPIIAVLGELNAGKSSVVASFLSDAGRKRLPRGVANERGTHRFIYWVPEIWSQDPQRSEVFRKFLAAAHGEQVEYLSEDPEEAIEQYRSGRNNPKLIQIPLIAYDAALEQRALLDCPDVQTLDQSEKSSHEKNLRLEFVTDAARLCSAFLLVWERAKLRDRLLTEYLEKLRSRMARVPLYLLINKIRPEVGQPQATRGVSV